MPEVERIFKKEEPSLKRVFLNVGEYFFSDVPSEVKTVLGSCVTLTMYDPKTKMGAMCHGLLPKCQNYGKCEKAYATCFRYVECSVWAMLDDFAKQGVRPEQLEVKLFGGASLTTGKNGLSDIYKIGQRNVQAAKEAIAEAGLKLLAFDFGGANSRRLTFRTDTGQVKLLRADTAGALDF